MRPQDAYWVDPFEADQGQCQHVRQQEGGRPPSERPKDVELAGHLQAADNSEAAEALRDRNRAERREAARAVEEGCQDHVGDDGRHGDAVQPVRAAGDE